MPKEMDEWSDNEYRLWVGMRMPAEAEADRYNQILYDAVMFSPEETSFFRRSARNALIDRLYNKYGVVFEESFNWRDYERNGESNG